MPDAPDRCSRIHGRTALHSQCINLSANHAPFKDTSPSRRVALPRFTLPLPHLPTHQRTVRVLVAARLVAVSRSPTVDNDPPLEPRFCSVTWNFISAGRAGPGGSQETTRGPETWRAATLHDHRSAISIGIAIGPRVGTSYRC